MVDPDDGPATPTGDALSADEPLYVGYLPMPAGHRRFLVRLLVVLGLSIIALAGVIAHFQRAPAAPGAYQGSARNVRVFDGVLYTQPYGILRVPGDTADAPTQTLLLTTGGKSGVAHLVTGLDGRSVQMKGTLRGRHGRHVFAMDTNFGIREIEMAATQRERLERPEARADSAGERILRGEIIDPKCFTGAMKPGDGKAHKACAINCLRGGIPPMFVTRDPKGQETFYLLQDQGGGAILEPLIPLVGDPVEVRGQVFQQGDMSLLRITPDSLRRL